MQPRVTKYQYKSIKHSKGLYGVVLGLAILFLIGQYNLVLINISPSVPMGIYVRTKKAKAKYVSFSKDAIMTEYQSKFNRLIKKYYFVGREKAYVYGDHPKSVTSEQVGLIDISELTFMRLALKY